MPKAVLPTLNELPTWANSYKLLRWLQIFIDIETWLLEENIFTHVYTFATFSPNKLCSLSIGNHGIFSLQQVLENLKRITIDNAHLDAIEYSQCGRFSQPLKESIASLQVGG
jgi:hypothetical protein